MSAAATSTTAGAAAASDDITGCNLQLQQMLGLEELQV
jgi:hypothetical protein